MSSPCHMRACNMQQQSGAPPEPLNTIMFSRGSRVIVALLLITTACLVDEAFAQAGPVVQMPEGPVYQQLGLAGGLRQAYQMATSATYMGRAGFLPTPATAAENRCGHSLAAYHPCAPSSRRCPQLGAYLFGCSVCTCHPLSEHRQLPRLTWVY